MKDASGAGGAGSAESEGKKERSALALRAAIVGAGTLVSRLLGLARDVAFAGIFPRAVTDAFFVAFTIPNALRQLLGEGAVSSAVVPVLSGKLATGGDEEGRAFFARARGVSLVALLIATALGMIFARPLTELFANGYHDRPAEFERTVSLTRAVFPYIFFMGSAALGSAALNAKRKFAVAAFAPGLLNVAFLICAFGLPAYLASQGTDPAYALAYGALAGGALQVIAQWPALRAIGYASRPKIDFKDPGVRDMLKRIAPMTAGIGVYYIDLVLSRRFLSDLGEGAQSYFSWAQRLSDFPQGIFVMALSTAALPSLSALAAKGEKQELLKTYALGMRLALFVAIPASALFVCLGEPIVRVLFQHGQFDAVATHETARALAWQGGAIWTVSAVRQLVPVFYATGETRTPVIVSALDLVSFIVLAVTLTGPLGHVGVSIAVAGSSAVQMVLLFVAMKRKLGSICAGEIGRSAIRTIAASGIGSFGGASAARMVGGGNLAGVIGPLAFAALFFLACWGLKSPELDALLGGAKSRLRRARK